MMVWTMVDHFKWALVGPRKTYGTTNCPSSDADVKGELDVQALMSFPFYYNKLFRMVVSTTYDTQVNLTHMAQKTLRSYARDLVNALILRT